MDFTIPKEVNILGFSGSILCMILETLKDHSFAGQMKIIKNIEVEDGIDFDPGYYPEILGIDDWVGPYENLFFGISKPAIKVKVFKDFQRLHNIQKKHFFSLSHSKSVIATSTTVGQGVYIEPGVTISPFAKIGFGSFINRHTSIGHHSTIGEFATINPGVHIAGHCHIGDETVVGMGTIVFDHVRVGKGTIIGGGSLVNKDLPSGVLAYGRPCQVIKKI